MIRIGIADDEDLVRDGLAALLGNQVGVLVVAAVGTTHEAVELALSGGIDVLLLDIELGKRGGLEVLSEIAAHPEARVRVIVVSSFAEEEYAVRTIRAGAAGYLRKASNPADLMTAIRTVVSGGRYISPLVADLLAEFATGGSPEPHHALSDREHQVFLLLAAGRSVAEIAEELSLSASSVSTYRRRILDKLELPSTAAIIRYAASRNLL